MPRIRQVSRQAAPETQMRTPAAQAEDFGGGEGLAQAGQQISQFAERVAEVQARKQNRVDSVARAKIRTKYLSYLNDEAMRVQSEEDITQPSTLAAFGTRARDYMNNLIATHEGSEESKARLMMNLEEAFSQQSRTLSSFAVSEGKKLVNQALDSEFTRAAVQAAATGDLDAGLAEVDVLVDEEYGGGLSPAEEAEARLRGRGLVYTNMYMTALEEENMENAKALLANDDFRVSVGDDAYRRYKLDFLSKQKTENEAMTQYNNNLEVARAITGEEPGKESDRTKIIAASGQFVELLPKEDDINVWIAEYIKLYGEYPPRADIERRQGLRGVARTPEESLAETNAALVAKGQEPLNPEQTRAFLAGVANSSSQGTDAKQRTQFLGENAEAFAQNLLTPEEDTRYIETALREQQARTRTVTTDQGVVTLTTPFSPAVQAALDARNVDLQTVSQLVSPEVEGYQPADIKPLPDGQTVFGTIENAVGPKQSFLAALSNVYFLGPLLAGEEGRRASAARQRILLNNRNLIAALINNSRGAVWEQQRLEADLGLQPGFFADPEGYVVKIVAVNDVLEQRKQQLDQIYRSARNKSEKDWASRSLEIINSYQRTVGLPNIVRDVQDVYTQGLEVGSAIFNPNTMRKGVLTQEWFAQNPDPRGE